MLHKIYDYIKYIIQVFKYRNYDVHWMGHSIIRLTIEIDKSAHVFVGHDVNFRPGCNFRIRENSELHVGDNVDFNNNCILTCRKKIFIGNNVMFGPNVLIFDNDHDYLADDFAHNYLTEQIIIEDNVWIGGNVCILRGAHIKSGSVIGAGSVVKGVVENNTLYYNKQNIQIKRIIK